MMAMPATKRQSLLALLITIITTIVVIVLGAHSAQGYYAQRERIGNEMRKEAAESIAQLAKTIAPLMEAYAANDYENLISDEIELQQHYAIIVVDHKRGKVLGADQYVIGKIRDGAGQVIDFDPANPEQRRQLESVFFTESAPINSAAGEKIGQVSVYTTDQAMRQEMAKIFRESMVATIVMALLLIASLVFFILRLFVRPLVKIAKTIEQRDSDGIPTSPAPDFGYREISVLTDTMNGMLDVIRRSRDSLEQERARMKNVIAGTNVGIWEWNVQTGESVFNERWAEIIGYSLAELAPLSIETWTRFAHPDDINKSGDLLARHFAGELPFYDCEARMRHKDGHWVWVLDRGKVASWTSDGKPLLISGTHQDISQHKHAEADLLESKIAAEAANLAKSRFLATMSHEIRTPMNAILGMAQLLLNSSMPEAERKDCVRTILNAGQPLLKLLNDILDLSKVEAGKLTLEQGVIEPRKILHEAEALLIDSARSNGLTVKFNWSGKDDQLYRGDPHRLRQMLLNLLNNAIKFTTQGRIEVEAQEIEPPGDDACLEFSVSDTGPGIAADKIDRLFTPFSQADDSTTRHFGGSGLGLSIVRSLAQLMGGDVGVESTPGQGSRFWFRVRAPRLAAEHHGRQTEPAIAASEIPQTLSGHLLLVDDDPTNRIVTRAFLSQIGVHCSVVENGQMAVDLITAQAVAVDAILMDLEMPVLDGLAATERIRDWEKASQRPRLPIIALTASVFPEARAHCQRVGIDDIISKPLLIEDLIITLGKWLKPGVFIKRPTAPVDRSKMILDGAKFIELSDTLLPMFKQGKFEAVDRFRELEVLVEGTSLVTELSEIRQDLQEFRFDAAAKALSEIRIKLSTARNPA